MITITLNHDLCVTDSLGNQWKLIPTDKSCNKNFIPSVDITIETAFSCGRRTGTGIRPCDKASPNENSALEEIKNMAKEIKYLQALLELHGISFEEGLCE